MTKKSQARLVRDQENARQAKKLKEEGRKGWDEINNLSDQVISLMMFPAALKEPLRNRTLMSYLTKEEGLDCANKVRLLEKDLTSMLEVFKGIRAQHAGRTGAEANFDEVMKTYGIAEQYVEFQSKYDAFIMPTKGDIIQHIANAEERMARAQMAKQATVQQPEAVEG